MLSTSELSYGKQSATVIVPLGPLKDECSVVPTGLANTAHRFPAINRWAIFNESLRDNGCCVVILGTSFPEKCLALIEYLVS
jgi:hypothetical protein